MIKTKPDLQKMAQDELSNLNFQIQSYYKAVDTNLLAILNDKDMTRSQVPALPSFPAVSERFNTEYQKMLDEENKKLENECMICTEVVDKNKHEDVFTCPVCQKDIHLDCVERWFQRSQTCPCCRTEWNWCDNYFLYLLCFFFFDNIKLILIMTINLFFFVHMQLVLMLPHTDF